MAKKKVTKKKIAKGCKYSGVYDPKTGKIKWTSPKVQTTDATEPPPPPPSGPPGS